MKQWKTYVPTFNKVSLVHAISNQSYQSLYLLYTKILMKGFRFYIYVGCSWILHVCINRWQSVNVPWKLCYRTECHHVIGPSIISIVRAAILHVFSGFYYSPYVRNSIDIQIVYVHLTIITIDLFEIYSENLMSTKFYQIEYLCLSYPLHIDTKVKYCRDWILLFMI